MSVADSHPVRVASGPRRGRPRVSVAGVRLAAGVAAAALLAACVGGTGASVPSSAPPSPSGAHASPSIPPLALPGDPDTVLIQVRTEGGFVPVDYRVTAFPELTVYADGRVVGLGAQIAIYPAPLLPPVLIGRLSSARLQILLADADRAGLRGGAGASYPPHGIADAPDTTFLVWAPEGATRTSFGALGMEQADVPGTEAAARGAATAFLGELTGGDLLASAAPYAPSAARLVVRDYADASPELPQPAVPWPLAAPLATAGSPLAPGSSSERCVVVTGADLATVWPHLEKANALTPFTSDGRKFSVVVRPLLPGEPTTCPAS